jgi:GABA permease
MRHYLVVANQTLKQPELAEKITACIDAGPSNFFLLVPATRAHEPVRWTPSDAVAVARRRLDSALERFRALGADVVGEVGDPSPVVAIGAVLRRRPFDALILSTLPVGPSQWLRHDVPTRIERLFNLPVELVTPALDLAAAEAAVAAADAADAAALVGSAAAVPGPSAPEAVAAP